MSTVARDFLRRVAFARHRLHELRDADAYTLECRIREDAAYLIGWGA